MMRDAGEQKDTTPDEKRKMLFGGKERGRQVEGQKIEAKYESVKVKTSCEERKVIM